MSDNPLKQYFRRPAVYIKLPSGGLGYAEGVIDMPETGELPVYPMTAIDEITSRTPDALFNGSAVVDIIKSCVPNIKDPWKLTNIDLDPILIAIRAATEGSTMEINTTCPSCEENEKYDVNLATIMSGFKPADYGLPLVLNEIYIKFKPLTYKEVNDAGLAQFEVQQLLQKLLSIEDEDDRQTKSGEVLDRINNLTLDLITTTIEYIKVPGATVMERKYILEFLKECDKKTHETIKNHSVKLRESTQNKPLKITCQHCKHEYEREFSINVSDFFG